jgi:hypothetical protein
MRGEDSRQEQWLEARRGEARSRAVASALFEARTGGERARGEATLREAWFRGEAIRCEGTMRSVAMACGELRARGEAWTRCDAMRCDGRARVEPRRGVARGSEGEVRNRGEASYRGEARACDARQGEERAGD